MKLGEAKEMIIAKYDIMEVIDILDLETYDILEAFPDRLVEQIQEFKDIYEAFDYDKD